MKMYNCQDCINLGSQLCDYCTVAEVPSGREQRPRYFVRATEIGACAEGPIPEFIKDCIARGKSISSAVVMRYNQDLEKKRGGYND